MVILWEEYDVLGLIYLANSLPYDLVTVWIMYAPGPNRVTGRYLENAYNIRLMTGYGL